MSAFVNVLAQRALSTFLPTLLIICNFEIFWNGDEMLQGFLTNTCREAELEEDDENFIGPPPPAVVAEAASANEAERFEEVF